MIALSITNAKDSDDTRGEKNVSKIAANNSGSVSRTAAKRSKSVDSDMGVTEIIQKSVDMDDLKTIAATRISSSMHPRLEGSAGQISSLMKSLRG